MVLTRRRASANEIIAGKLWQRGQFASWPYSQKHELLEELGIDTIVNLWHKVDPDLSAESHGGLYVTWHISPSELPHDADLMVDFLSRLLYGGHRMLVHCEAGKGRSVWLASRLTAAYLAISREEAFAQVREAVGNTSVHGPLLADLLLTEGME